VRRALVLVVVLGLAAALFLWKRGDDPRHDFGSDVGRCTENLRTIYAGLVAYQAAHGHPPAGSGAAFVLELGTTAGGGLARDVLTCPGPGAEAMPAGLDLANASAFPPGATAYAGRDLARFPLSRFPSGGTELEPIACCDNARGLNHDGVMNVLYSDGSVITLQLEQLVGAGRLPADATTIPVGPTSPIPELAKLSD